MISRSLLTGVLVVLVMVSLAVPAAASVQLSSDAEYEGIEGDSESIVVTIEISPEDEAIEDVVIDIDGSNQAFVDFESFDRSVTPGAAQVNISYRGNGEFYIERLEPGQTVTITYEAYPRTIREDEITASTVNVQYVQLGQELENSEQITVDMSNSAWHAYQSTESNELWATVGQILAGANTLLVVGVVGWFSYRWATGGDISVSESGGGSGTSDDDSELLDSDDDTDVDLDDLDDL